MKASVSIRVCLVLVLFAIASNTAPAGSATLAWQPSPSEGVVAYHVYYGNRSYQSSLVVPSQTTTAEIDGLDAGATYYFLVTAVNAAGAESRPSNEALFTVSSDLPSASARLNNISTRANVLPASGATIAGLVIGGTDDLTSSGPLLFNVSTRGFVGTDDHVLIGGFMARSENTRVVVRALGPSLRQFGISAALADPALMLFDSNGNVIASNDNWTDDYPADIQFAP